MSLKIALPNLKHAAIKFENSYFSHKSGNCRKGNVIFSSQHIISGLSLLNISKGYVPVKAHTLFLSALAWQLT